MISLTCIDVFRRSVSDFHVHNDVDAPVENPFLPGSLEHLFYSKNYIDTVQWHLEDIVRDPQIDPIAGLALKRRIDKSNQDRTDLVEQIDDFFLSLYKDVHVDGHATINTESPAWAIDRLSILILKIWHMSEEVLRPGATEEHQQKCNSKLQVLLEQEKDLSNSIDELIEDISSGKKIMKVYRQMKMYNDPSLNPVLYNSKSHD
jgi:hypothetical protein